jgi:hypothetical protein
MTRLFITILVLFLVCTGCSVFLPTDAPIVTITPEVTTEPTVEATAEQTPVPTPYHPGGPDLIRLYVHRALVGEEFRSEWIKGKDIGVFYAYPVEQETVEQLPFMDLFKKYWYVFPSADDYKIGYSVVIELYNGETIDMTIRLPKDSPKDPKAYFYQFIEIYVYDNLNRIPGPTFYHLEESSTFNNTIMTSIKLTAGSRSDEVREIRLTAFVFDGDSDFDSVSGKYTGKTFCEVVVAPEIPR